MVVMLAIVMVSVVAATQTEGFWAWAQNDVRNAVCDEAAQVNTMHKDTLVNQASAQDAQANAAELTAAQVSARNENGEVELNEESNLIHWAVVTSGSETILYLGNTAHTLAEGEALKDANAQGSMENTSTTRPWSSYSATVTQVIVESTIKPTSTAYWFRVVSGVMNDYSGCISVDLEKLDTSNVTDMEGMFMRCSRLKTLDLTNFDTSNVTDMGHMFYGCSSLTNLNVTSFNTTRVTNMVSMFSGCYSLTSLDVGGFDIANVRTIAAMFRGCSTLTTIDVSNWNTGSVTSFYNFSEGGIFEECSCLKTIDVSNWDTSNVTDMSLMFKNCEALTSVDVSNWDTSNVKSVSGMFVMLYRSDNLTIIDISKWNTTNVTNVSSIFSGCEGLTSLDLSNWDLSNVTKASYMFSSCTSLSLINLPKAMPTDTSVTIDLPSTFYASTDANATGYTTLIAADVANGITVLAKRLEVTYDANGGTGTMDKSYALWGTDSALSENAFIRDGFDFAGWNTNADGSGTAYGIGDTINVTANQTLYAQWTEQVQPEKTVTFVFLDFDGTVISEVVLTGNTFTVPSLPNHTNDYLEYTFKHWKDNNGNTYTTENLPSFDLFVDGDTVEFTAVYYVRYLKQFNLEGSVANELTNSEIYDREVLIAESENDVDVVTNFAITRNDGIAALLLVPQYNKDLFTIKSVSVNGQLVFGTGATSSVIFNGWTVTVTGTEASADVFRILIENYPTSSATGELFVQIVYEMSNPTTGEYNFGFVTKYADNTYDRTTDSELSHNDRSEAYSVLSDNADAWFYELKIGVTEANVMIIARQDATLTVEAGQSLVYDSNSILAVDVAQTEIERAIRYAYSGFNVTLMNDVTLDWTKYLTISWYDANQTLLTSAPVNAGTYYIVVSATQNEYFNAITTGKIAFTITPYIIDVNVTVQNNKTYNGQAQTWTKEDLSITDVIATLNNEIGYNVVLTNATYTNAGTYDITVKFTSTANYKFENGAEKEITLTVVMNKFALTVTADDKTSVYGDGLVSLTYTLSDNSAFITTDITGNKLTITLTKANGTDAGTYAVNVNVNQSVENYDITTVNGVYTITRKQIAIPVIVNLTYNGTAQFPQVINTDNGIYGYTGDTKKDAGSYTLTATLTSANYVWSDYVGTNNENTLARSVEWKIVAADITVTIDNKTSVYSEALANLTGNVTSGTAYEALSTIVSYEISNPSYKDGNLVVGTYSITGTDNSDNYNVTFVNGTYTVTKKVLDTLANGELAEIIAKITGATKAYTGSTITWTVSDFTIDSSLSGIIGINAVSTISGVDYINANGKLTGESWTYYSENTQLKYVVSISLVDSANYTLYMDGNTEKTSADVNIEVFIAQATNEWTVGPTVTATDITTFATEADAKFKANGEVVVVIKDKNGNTVTIGNLLAGTKYDASFTVAETNNYTGLATTIEFELGFAKVAVPVVRLDSESGTVVTANGSVSIIYDGNTHSFVIIPDGAGRYVVTVSTNDNYASWKNAGGNYSITIALTNNYSWSDGNRENLTYTLVINKATLTVTAENKVVTYRDDVPAYTAVATGFVNGENGANYSATFKFENYINCDYAQGDDAGTYTIGFVANAESTIEGILSNYDVILVDGTLTVNKLALDLTGVKGKLDNGSETAWATLVTNGFTTQYNAVKHTVTISGYPIELVPSVVYSNGSATDAINAGSYTITVTFAVADGYNASNFTWSNPDAITLTITKVRITATAEDQAVYYTSNAVVIDTSATKASLSLTDGGNISDTAYNFIRNATTGVTVNGVALNGSYTNVGTYENVIRAQLTFDETNYVITYVDGTLTVEKGSLTWEVELTAVDRVYNGEALVEGNETDKADYFAKVSGGEAMYLEYKFYTLTDGTYTEIVAPTNAGTYYIKAFYDDNVHTAMESDYIKIVISKVTVTVTVTAENRNYLQNLVYDAVTTNMSNATSGDDVQGISYMFSTDNSTWTNILPQNVGTYYVKAMVNETTNYTGAEDVVSFTINTATLKGVEFTYSLNEASWNAVTQSVDGEDLDKYGNVIVTYTVKNVGGDVIYTTTDTAALYKFTANAIGVYTLTASVEGDVNFSSSETNTVEVFSITFSDKVDNHNRNTTVVDFSSVAPVQYRFSGQSAAQPAVTGIELEGYTFAGKWLLDGNDYSFANTVTASIMLYAKWTINTYTVTWKNDNVTIYTATYEYRDKLVYDTTKGTPERATTAEWIYTFIGWNTDLAAETTLNLDTYEVKSDIELFAIFSKEGVGYTVTFMLSVDGGEYTQYGQVTVKFGDALVTACSLADVMWFRSEFWYSDEARTQKMETAVAENITVYGAYIFNIGNGDVNASGTVTTNDITLYRQWIVGGYEMTVVENGKEWETVTSDSFNANSVYFLVRVADVNKDASEDIRDITTIRMAAVGGFGYVINEADEVTGENVDTYKVPEIDENGSNSANAEGDAVVTNGNYSADETSVVVVVFNTCGADCREGNVVALICSQEENDIKYIIHTDSKRAAMCYNRYYSVIKETK